MSSQKLREECAQGVNWALLCIERDFDERKVAAIKAKKEEIIRTLLSLAKEGGCNLDLVADVTRLMEHGEVLRHMDTASDINDQIDRLETAWQGFATISSRGASWFVARLR